MAILSLHTESSNSSIVNIPPNLTNPVCIGTAALLADEGSTADANLGTNSSFPLPLDQSVSKSDVQTWCPWDLQLQPPTKPRDGVYSYPDSNIQRPVFNPCYSACAKYNQPNDCCTGAYGSPNTCKPSTYSQDAKKICPDAYSFGKSGLFNGSPISSRSLDSQLSTIKPLRSSFPRAEGSRSYFVLLVALRPSSSRRPHNCTSSPPLAKFRGPF